MSAAGKALPEGNTGSNRRRRARLKKKTFEGCRLGVNRRTQIDGMKHPGPDLLQRSARYVNICLRWGVCECMCVCDVSSEHIAPEVGQGLRGRFQHGFATSSNSSSCVVRYGID